MSANDSNGLIELHLDAAAPDRERQRDGIAANDAPAREPEVWDERIPDFNPLLSHTPEAEPVQLSPGFSSKDFSVEEYLAAERAKDLLRFSTAGSVDDGKSTLIGRLLYDTSSVYDDQIRSIEGKGTTAPGVLDLALLTDGLRAEREQGITIDVAYRYFATEHRRFIIADTPGHEQYTRNMATGASTADLAIVLVDARKGVLAQSRRHAAITGLLGVRHLVLAVNKMDLVGYSSDTFADIERDFRGFLTQLAANGIGTLDPAEIHVVPVSALTGDNVAHRAETMPWYTGPTLLQLLESLPAASDQASAPFRFPVQRVVRPDLDFRGFAGQIASGTVRPGDPVVVQPSGQSSRVARIVTFDGDLQAASAPLSVTLTLSDEIDISRGDLLSSPETPATTGTELSASLVWMAEAPMALNSRLLLKHTSRTVQAEVRSLDGLVDLTSATILPPDSAATLGLNGIGLVTLETRLPLTADTYSRNRHTGSFVLIDPQSNGTVAAGMIRSLGEPSAKGRVMTAPTGRVSARERSARFGHSGTEVVVRGPVVFAEALERALFAEGANVFLLQAGQQHLADALRAAGLLVLQHEPAAESAVVLPEAGTVAAASVEQAMAHLRDADVVHRKELA